MEIIKKVSIMLALFMVLMLAFMTGCVTVKPAETPMAEPETVLTIVKGAETKTFTLEEIEAMPSYTAIGGLWCKSSKIVKCLFEYTGVKLTDLLDLAGGIGKENTVKVIASDDYTEVFTYEQLKGGFKTFDQEGNPIEWDKTLTAILSYKQNGNAIPIEKGGPLRITIVGPGDPLTLDRFWVKWVERIEIEKAPPLEAVKDSINILKGGVESLHTHVRALMPLVKDPEKNSSEIQGIADSICECADKIEDYTGGFHDAVHKLMAADGGSKADTLHDYAHDLGYLLKHVKEYAQNLTELAKAPGKNESEIQDTSDNIDKYAKELKELVEEISEFSEKP